MSQKEQTNYEAMTDQERHALESERLEIVCLRNRLALARYKKYWDEDQMWRLAEKKKRKRDIRIKAPAES